MPGTQVTGAPLVHSGLMSVDALLSRVRPLVDARLGELIPPEAAEPELLHQAMRYMALAPGKRIRPAFSAAAFAAVGGEGQGWLDPACAAELVHCFSLIHDDLPAIDNDDLRRGRPTCHVRYGEAAAILAGDALFALAFQALAEMDQPDGVRAACCASLSRASGSTGLVAGEMLDILGEKMEPEEGLLNRIHAWKTGALIASACRMGALAAGASSEQACALEAFGMSCGLAFQAADDILNEEGSAEELGKAVGTDRELGKQTYPAVYGLEESKRRADAMLSRAVADLRPHVERMDELEALALFCLRRTV